MDEKIVALGAGTISGTDQNKGSISAETHYSGAISGVVGNAENLNGNVTINKDVAATISDTGSLAAMNVTNGASTATLSLRPGIDGQDGKDGFSPTITVEKDTKTEYVLRITDINGSYLTPNLYPDIKGLEDIEALVAGKVDEDLAEYTLLDPSHLTEDQRENSYIYSRVTDINAKFKLSDIALMSEVKEQIKRKLQTVEEVPETSG